MERWLLFGHLAAVLLFMLAHGVHVQVMWRMRTEADPRRIEWLFHPLPSTRLLQALLAAIIVSGLAAGFVTPWWRQWWMWIALALLLGMTWVMRRYGAGYFELIERAALASIAADDAEVDPALRTATRAEFDRIRLGWHPLGVSVIGLGGLAAILWLMIFKPF